MNRAELVERLTVERFWGGWLTKDIPDNSDNDINTAKRRRELAEATVEKDRRSA